MTSFNEQRLVAHLATGALALVLSAAACSSSGVSLGTQTDPGASVDAGTDASSACAPGEQRCARAGSGAPAACVDLVTDHDNCGACGNACGADRFCRAGHCQTCAEGALSSCNGVCADLLSDPKHCGTCEGACSDSTVCNNGLCAATCTSGKTACRGSCIDTSTDAANCGACGHACAAGQTCSAGACQCADAKLVACGATCVNPETDKLHCGATSGCGSVPGYAGTACLANGYCEGGACHTCNAWTPGTLVAMPDLNGYAPFFALADLNGDSKPDLAVVKIDAGAITIFLGNGDGTFTERTSFTVGPRPTNIAVGDIDGDGKRDLVVGRVLRSEARADFLTTWIGRGDGTFEPGPLVEKVSAVESLAVGDVDGNGRDDIVAASSDDAHVYLASTTGPFTASGNYAQEWRERVGAGPFQLVLADGDGDGRRDLVVSTQKGVGVYFGDGAGALGSPWVSSSLDAAVLVTGDANSDGKIDILARGSNPGQWSALLGGTAGNARTWSLPILLTWNAAFASQLTDATGDGIPDLVGVTNTHDGASERVIVRAGRGDGTFLPAESFSYGSAAIGAALVVADLNGDGRADIAGMTTFGIQILLGVKANHTQCP